MSLDSSYTNSNLCLDQTDKWYSVFNQSWEWIVGEMRDDLLKSFRKGKSVDIEWVKYHFKTLK